MEGASGEEFGWTRSSVAVDGVDAARFLNNLCSADAVRQAVGTAREAFFLNAKGRVLDFGLLLRHADERFEILLDPTRAVLLRTHLDRYLIREKVTLGAAMERTVRLLFGTRGDGSAWRLGDVDATIWGGADSNVEADRRSNLLRACLIAGGFPRYGVDLTEENLAQEMDRNEAALSFTKGCYLGQETVARLDALGHVNKILRTLEFPAGAMIEAGVEAVAGDKVVGRIGSVAALPDRTLALAVVRVAAADEGTALTVGNAAGFVRRVTVSELLATQF